ncbi:MAG: class I adenylate-forming enzyme family protein, partial [Myxococcota bacterium]
MNIAGAISQAVGRDPTKVAYICDGREYTWIVLDDMVSRAAASLKSMGLQKGDRAAIYHQSSIEFIAAWLAIVKLGAIAVPVNVMLKEREVGWILSDSGARIVLHGPEQDHVLRMASHGLKTPPATVGMGPSGLRTLFGDERLDGFEECDPDDTATLIYTSGTTGRPKGAELTHRNFECNTDDIIAALKYDDNMVRVSVTPLFHTMGLTVVIIANTKVCGTAVIQPRFEPKAFLAANELYHANMVSGAPALHYMITASPVTSAFNLKGWKHGFSGSAPLPERLQRAFEAKFDIPLLNCYG